MMKIQRSNKKIWIGMMILLVLFVLSSFFIQPKQRKTYPPYVSESPSPTGVKAFYTYLKSEMKVERWTRSVNHLPKEKENQLLIMIQPYFIPDAKQMAAYEQFMEAGNTILLFQDQPEGMFGLHTESMNERTTEEKIFDRERRAYHTKMNQMRRLQKTGDDTTLLEDEAGPVALKRPFGKGQLIVAIEPEWMTNEKIVDKDHLPLILSLLNDHPMDAILFDETIHKEVTSQWSVYPMWFLLILVPRWNFRHPLALVPGKRFGPIFTPREETVRFSDEGIQALAAWYIRGRRYHDSLVIQADYVKLLLQERWEIPYQ